MRWPIRILPVVLLCLTSAVSHAAVHLVLEVDVGRLNHQRFADTAGAIRSQLRLSRVAYGDMREDADGVSVRIADPAKMDSAAAALAEIDDPLSASGKKIQHYAVSQDGPGEIHVRLRDADSPDIHEESLDLAATALRARLEALGIKDAAVRRMKGNRIAVEVANVGYRARLNTLLDKPTLSMRLVDDTVKDANAQPGIELLEQWPSNASRGPLAVYKRAFLGGDDIGGARNVIEKYLQTDAVLLSLTAEGAKAFAGASKAQVGRRIAIVLDGKVVSAPVVEMPILDGRMQISGLFTRDEAVLLAFEIAASADGWPFAILGRATTGQRGL